MELWFKSYVHYHKQGTWPSLHVLAKDRPSFGRPCILEVRARRDHGGRENFNPVPSEVWADALSAVRWERELCAWAGVRTRTGFKT